MLPEWTRAEIEALKLEERPLVRVRYNGQERQARIGLFERKAFVEVCENGRWMPFTVSWGLLLAVLNDPKESPIVYDSLDAERCFRYASPRIL